MRPLNTGQLNHFGVFLVFIIPGISKLEDDFQSDVNVDKLDTLGEQSSSE